MNIQPLWLGNDIHAFKAPYKSLITTTLVQSRHPLCKDDVQKLDYE
jgi:hypothetical protein